MKNQSRILDFVLPEVQISGDASRFLSYERVAFIASYGRTSKISRSLATFVMELELGGYGVVVIRASESQQMPIWPTWFFGNPVVVRKPNFGYDFGSWATGLALFPELAKVPYVILANDSLLGPFATIASMLADFESSGCDVWGVANSNEITNHLQSFFLGFKRGVLSDRVLREFWLNVRHIEDKDLIVEKYELGLSRLLFSEGYVMSSWVDHVAMGCNKQDPTLLRWFYLLQLGFPFVKRMLVSNADVFPGGHDVGLAVKALYGTELELWL